MLFGEYSHKCFSIRCATVKNIRYIVTESTIPLCELNPDYRHKVKSENVKIRKCS